MGTTSLADMSDPATYIGWGWLSVSVPNLIVILVRSSVDSPMDPAPPASLARLLPCTGQVLTGSRPSDGQQLRSVRFIECPP